MAVRHALGYKQVGGEADGAADASPSPLPLSLVWRRHETGHHKKRE